MNKTLFAVMVSLAAILLGLILPMSVANIKDNERDSSVESFESTTGGTEIMTELSLADKLRIASDNYTGYVGIEKGNRMTEEEVIDSVVDFSELFEGLIGEMEGIYEIAELSLQLATENDGAGDSFVCWYVLLPFEKCSVGFTVDDGTGLVLKLAIASFEEMEMPDIDEMEKDISSAAKTLAVYYDLDFAALYYPSDGEQCVWNIIYEYGDEGIRICISFSDYGVVINDAYRENDAQIIVN